MELFIMYCFKLSIIESHILEIFCKELLLGTFGQKWTESTQLCHVWKGSNETYVLFRGGSSVLQTYGR